MPSPFVNMQPRQRGAATTSLHAWERQIQTWQQEAQSKEFGGVVGYPMPDFREYLGFTDFELTEYTSSADFVSAVRMRRAEVRDRINRMKLDANVKHGLGKDHKYLPDGAYVYFAICFNHGAGARFLGYIDTDPDFGLTPVDEWT